ncbi:MAG: TRAM domain-containing protein, partial [Sinobacteraceae bacterium]|nr:TRAM domain-containing protein [Nevskiaceae bacterium]
NFAGPQALIGRFADVRVTEARAHTLRGRLDSGAAWLAQGAPPLAAGAVS